ncbi:MAG: folate-binding protein YgfZ [Alphaproteobacteria bacterium]|nr:folate-binding protein YgfZ [Alphaproteobacteria bacterium]
MSFPTTVLPDRAVIQVAGPDAATFLQGLITNDIAKVENGRAIYAALLTPQGKIITDFLVAPIDGGFLLDCAKAQAADLAARLKKYKLRAKVTIAERADLAVIASPQSVAGGFADPRLPALGFRAYQRTAGDNATAYHAHRIALGVPDSSDIAPETHFPLDCNFEELHGVDFEKGCYVGQELTARMKHRASARRRILPVSAASLPPPGTSLTLGTTDIGEMMGGLDSHGLAIIRLDRLVDATEATAAGATVHIGRPSYPLILGA